MIKPKSSLYLSLCACWDSFLLAALLPCSPLWTGSCYVCGVTSPSERQNKIIVEDNAGMCVHGTSERARGEPLSNVGSRRGHVQLAIVCSETNKRRSFGEQDPASQVLFLFSGYNVCTETTWDCLKRCARRCQPAHSFVAKSLSGPSGAVTHPVTQVTFVCVAAV